ncbi:MAG: DUF1189 family protein [Candidatus Izemoplasmatales bacterium]
MYNIAKDSIFQPKELLNYRHKSGWFTTLYLLVLALFVSLSAIIHYGWYKGNTVITTETTGCTIRSGELVCDQAAYEPGNKFHLYGYSIHFLASDDQVSSIINLMDQQSLVFKGNSMSLYFDGEKKAEVPVFSQSSASLNFDIFFQSIKTGLLLGLLLFHFLGNLFLLLMIGLVSTLPFIRLKKFIPYKTIFKLVIFALTPTALLMTIYNLLDFSEIIFFLLLLIGYRSIYQLQRELHFQTLVHLEKRAMNIVDAEYRVTDDEEDEQDDEDGKTDLE